MSDLPKEVSRSEITIAGYRLRVIQLDDGRRIFDAEDFEALMGAWFRGEVKIADFALPQGPVQ